MFILKTLRDRGEYRTLVEAISAARINDLNLATTMIERNGFERPVNDWIMVHIAGGDLYTVD